MNHLALTNELMQGHHFGTWIAAINIHLEHGEYPLAVRRMLSSGVLAQYQNYDGLSYVGNCSSFYGAPDMTLAEIDRQFQTRVFDMPLYDLLGVKRQLKSMVADLRYDESVDMLTAGEDWQWDYVRTLLGYVDTLVWMRQSC